MPTRRIGPAGLAACVLGGALVLVVAALATVPYAIERLLDRGGEVAGVRWSASGASFSWPLDFRADTLVVEKDGVRISLTSPSVLLGFEDGIFGDHPLELKARKVEVVQTPGTAPEGGADEGTDAGGNACRIFIENQGTWEDGFTPSVVTDSPLLAGWETAALSAAVEVVPDGVLIRILRKAV